MGSITACSIFYVNGNDPVEREKLMTKREMGEFLKGYVSKEERMGSGVEEEVLALGRRVISS